MAETPPRALTIAGSDSGGAAGLEADLRAMTACGVHGCVAVTAVTVQNSLGVSGVHLVPPDVVAAQVQAVVSDIGVGAAKTGMLATAEIIEAVAGVVDEVGIGRGDDQDTQRSGAGPSVPFLIDPVAASMYGEPLLADDAMEAFRTLLFPRAALVTPNLDEVRLLTGVTVTGADSARKAADALHDLGARWVLVKGGHLHGSPEVTDLLSDGERTWEFTGPRIDTPHVHGAGDALGSATCAGLARGLAVPDAVAYAERYIRRAVAAAYPLGQGTGPVSPLWAIAEWDEP
ncbi:bifunctional hydroxymethylpyrimidine kinase/phosphomethylpyrimidine kinase [Actinomycetospora sp. TBRC 11914]|uniref:bifunctional hydroxymethylpyrimidine kinase/phosphomethylpyrimidine kinase n=1 Tax=Actinomycetospora sp. TBRC 11914 TaxID=2729387 RepID=UPI00145D9221|nr:bifunctional hydroxymethylpyrimidine kinase/phosphomethylpyrimidine kinase [Actinomycetospora sp. TBRC 11914]NMO89035.1 bifunctional hydroxymethylpyrimidine kinase/phosphomethylpyrimidine kinase [Actinomycetospora sp. TBRC 11914]